MERLYSKLYVTVLHKPERIGMGYRYLITDSATSQIAFRHKNSFKRWLKERGLKLKPAQRWSRGRRDFYIIGSYKDVSMMDVEAFDRINAPTTKVMDNGSYTLGKILQEGDCISIIHLNCNVSRATFDSWETIKTHG